MNQSINQSLYFETNTRREQHYRTKTGRHLQYVGLYFPFFGKLLLVCERLFNSGEINGRTVVGTAKRDPRPLNWSLYTFNSPLFTIIEPPLTATYKLTYRLQRPRFLFCLYIYIYIFISQGGQKNPYIDSCLNPLYNCLHLCTIEYVL